MSLMRLSGTKAGRRREVFSDATGAATSRLTTPVRSSQRNSDRSDDISRFIEAALRRPSSVRKMIHSRMSSVVTRRRSESVSLIPNHARNSSMSWR